MSSQIKEYPILFSAPMIRAILGNRKSQTRRVVKPQPIDIIPADCVPNGCGFIASWCDKATEVYEHLACPYGRPGDRLWVRETFWADKREPHGCVIYAATPELHKYSNSDMVQSCDPGISTEYLEKHEFWVRKPSIHMPRWASRITLELTAVRVERLQKIDTHDAFKEGISCPACDEPTEVGDEMGHIEAVPAYKKLWDSINAKKHPWASNPWVWVLMFKRI